MVNEYDDEFLRSLNQKLAQYFFESKEIVHVSLKDGAFYNGRLFSIGTDFFEIHDREDGLKIIFFMELKKKIIKFEEEGK